MPKIRTVGVVAVSSLILASVITAVMVMLSPTPRSSLSSAVHPDAGPKPLTTSAPLANASASATVPSPTQIAVPVSAVCAATAPGVKEIYVSISQQHIWACTGKVLLVDGAVTTGASALTNVHDATPVGLSRIHAKIRNTVLRGHDVNGSWNDPVAYWMPFSGGDGFHNAPWQTFPLGSPLYTTQGSHGCVHVALDVLAQVYNWAEVGTLVNIQA